MTTKTAPEITQFVTGNDLRVLRKYAGFTTTRMAEIAGVKTRKTYENWEKNKGSPCTNQLIAMAIACKVNPVAFLKDCIERG
jgi:transcriptional regulator with XRE-family HTH domain